MDALDISRLFILYSSVEKEAPNVTAADGFRKLLQAAYFENRIFFLSAPNGNLKISYSKDRNDTVSYYKACSKSFSCIEYTLPGIDFSLFLAFYKDPRSAMNANLTFVPSVRLAKLMLMEV